MMEQSDLFNNSIPKDKNIISIGTQLYLKFNSETFQKVALYNNPHALSGTTKNETLAKLQS